MWCRAADDSVVVLNFRPVKPGNGVEDKTEGRRAKLRRDSGKAKSAAICEGMKTDQRALVLVKPVLSEEITVG